MKVVYVAHPLGGGVDRGANLSRAARWVAWAALQGVAPVADWILIALHLPETPEHRARGLAVDLVLVARCDEVWLVGGRVSPGMAQEANEAVRLGVPVRDLTALGIDPPAERIVLPPPCPSPSMGYAGG